MGDSMQTGVAIRLARTEDASAIAALHTANWQDAYRGIMPDDYLDGRLAAEMQVTWAEKLVHAATGASAIFLAEQGGVLRGFIRIVANADPAWGHYIDNLHVAAGTRGGGFGRALFNTGAEWAMERGGKHGLYLYVYADNAPARAAYARWQGREVEEFLDDAPHGGKIPAVRVAWDAGR